MNIPSGGKQPATWQDYEQGRGSPASDSRIQWAVGLERQESATSTHSHLAVPPQNGNNGHDPQLRQRRYGLLALSPA